MSRFPGAVNSIPSRVTLEIDVRDIERARRDAVLDAIKSAVEEIASRRGVRVRQETINADNPARCDAGLVDGIGGSSSRESGLAPRNGQ